MPKQRVQVGGGGCMACAAGCQKQFGYVYYCCHYNNCCCYSAPSPCSAHPACPSNECKSVEEIDANGTISKMTTCGVGAGGPADTKSSSVNTNLAKSVDDSIQV